jgi:hypothetical protein
MERCGISNACDISASSQVNNDHMKSRQDKDHLKMFAGMSIKRDSSRGNNVDARDIEKRTEGMTESYLRSNTRVDDRYLSYRVEDEDGI